MWEFLAKKCLSSIQAHQVAERVHPEHLQRIFPGGKKQFQVDAVFFHELCGGPKTIQKIDEIQVTRWWFQILIFTPILGEMIQFDLPYVSSWGGW